MKKISLLIFSLIATLTNGNAQELISKFDNTVNGPVNTIELDEYNNVIYLGGEFSKAGYLGKYGTQLSKQNGLVPDSYPFPNGPVYASCADDVGGYYIGGSFTKVGDSVRNNLAHINADGIVTSWANELIPDGIVRTLQRKNGKVYVGGEFISYNPEFNTSVVNLSSETGLKGMDFPKVNGKVHAIISDDNDGWYIGGEFTEVGTEKRRNLAHIKSDGTLGELNKKGGPDKAVYTLLKDDSDLYVGGNFNSIANENSVSSGLAIVESNGNYSGLDLAIDGNNSKINSIVPDGKGGYYIGGSFSLINGKIRSNIAHIDQNGEVTEWDPYFYGSVRLIKTQDTLVFVAGAFNRVNNHSHRGFAVIGSKSGKQYFKTLEISSVSDFGFDNDTIYLAGGFLRVGEQDQKYLAAWDLSERRLLSWNPSPDRLFGGKIIVNKDYVFLAGNFTSIGGKSISRIAKIRKSDGTATSWNPYPNGAILDMAEDGRSLYVVGHFTYIGNRARFGIAEIDKIDGISTEWHPVEKWNINPDENYHNRLRIRNIAIDDSTVFFAGHFNTIDTSSRHNIARVRKENGKLVEWDFPIERGVKYFGLDGSDVILYSDTDTVFMGGNSRNSMAKIDLNSRNIEDWKPKIDEDFDDNSYNLKYVLSLAASKEEIFVAGNFEIVAGENTGDLVALNKQTAKLRIIDSPKDSVPSYGLYDKVRDIKLVDSTLYCVGSYSDFDTTVFHKSIVEIDIKSGKGKSLNDGYGGTGAHSIEIEGDVIYLGRRGIVAISSTDGSIFWEKSIDRAFRRLEQNEVAIANDIDGGRLVKITKDEKYVYLAGNFSSIGGQSKFNVARLNKLDGTVDSWDPSADDIVTTVENINGNIFIGGLFNSSGGKTTGLVTTLDEANGKLQEWRPTITGNVVRSIALDDSLVYLGGDFDPINGSRFRGLGSLSQNMDTVTPWVPTDFDGTTVYDIKVDSNIYVGSRRGLMVYDKKTGGEVNWSPNFSGNVKTIALDSNYIYFGGYFDNVNSIQRNNIASIEKNTGKVSEWDPNPDNMVNSIAIDSSFILIGGKFDSLGTKFRKHVGVVDKAKGLSNSFNPIADAEVFSVSMSEKSYFVGGNFIHIGGKDRKNLASIGLTDGKITYWNPSPNGPVHAIKIDSNEVYVGGSFSLISETSRNNTAKFNAEGNLSSWDPDADDIVYAIELNPKKVFLGGKFKRVGGLSRSHIVRVDKETGSIDDWQMSLDSYINNIIEYGKYIYASGDFLSVNDDYIDGLAKINIKERKLASWKYNRGGGINDFVIKNDNIYITGDIDYSRPDLYTVDTAEAVLNSIWYPNIPDLKGFGNAIAINENELYVGGDFEAINDQKRYNIAILDTKRATSPNWNPIINRGVNAIAYKDSILFIGGDFTAVNDKSSNYFAAITKPDLVRPSFTSIKIDSLEENDSEFEYVIITNEKCSYSLGNSNDESIFNLSGNKIIFKESPDFERPEDINRDNHYELEIKATDDSENSDTLILKIKVQNINDEEPVINSPSTFNVEENSTFVGEISASDLDSEKLSYSAVGGNDLEYFVLIDQSIFFKEAPNFEITKDSNQDNVYELKIQVSDSTIDIKQDISIFVIDTEEIAGDINGDGVIGDGEVAGDINNDGTINNEEIAGDIDGNGIIDEGEVAGDVDGNGEINNSEVEGDEDGNGELSPEEKENILSNSDEINSILYPNPADNLIQIKEVEGRITSFKILDFAGRILIEKDQVVNPVKIDISELSSGSYLLLMMIENKEYQFQFVKNSLYNMK